MRKRYDLNDIVVYSQKKKIPHTVMQPYASPRSDLDEVVKQLEEPKPELKQLTDKDGLDRSYEAKNDLSIIDNTVYISGTHMNRPSDWYDDVFKVPSLWNAVPLVSQYKAFMFGMKALPYVGDLARQADKGVPYLSTALKVVPLLAPEYTEAAMAVDDSLGAVSMGLKATPHIANAASSIAQKVDNVLPFGSFGDITTTSRYKAAEKALKDNPNITRAVGDSLGGAVALELQKHHPELKVRTYGAPVVDFKGAVQPNWSANTERYRNFGDPISMFDSSAHTTVYPHFYDQKALTHQYQNNANKIKPD